MLRPTVEPKSPWSKGRPDLAEMQQAFWLYYDLKKRPRGLGEKRKGDPDETESTDEDQMPEIPSLLERQD